ncbi:MAG: DUF4910 domain-containing protein [Chitinivibrionales bacterium]|nr:DUF4910 domain-containing protein [Chitinivibrionales bacterium]
MNTLRRLIDTSNPGLLGKEMYALVERLYPICRSITGKGVEQTLAVVRDYIDLDIHAVASGSPAFDWTVPREWNIRDAWVKNPRGEKVIDFQRSNLHVLNYSIPVHTSVSLKELKEHLYTIPEYPDWIPYRTSYYTEAWGFCTTHRLVESLPPGDYEVCIDATLEPGHLTYGEYRIAGESDDEVLISTHICHPSLCNDNLSGIALATVLARSLATAGLRYSYRFLFIPGTIGSITWLSRNTSTVSRIRHGLVVTCVGDAGPFTYKKSRHDTAVIDRAVALALSQAEVEYSIVDFYPYGYDERQYCSPGFDLAVGSLTRSSHGTYPQYHTSADNLQFVGAEHLAESLQMYLKVIAIIEGNQIYRGTQPYCEPQLGKRGLYRAGGGPVQTESYRMALLWVLNMADGKHSMLDIAERSKLPFDVLDRASSALLEAGLIVPE